MITRIELTNFMSHRRTVIEPAAGLTVLVGPNNCGKSAVVAALQILCRNENSTYVLRHGEKECGITLHTDDGHVIEWRRKNSPSYRINGQAFDRLGRNGVPDELHEALRLPLVEGGADTDFDVHFGAQKSPIFLLGSSAQNAARFFASSSDASRLVAMQKRHKEKLSEAQKDKNRLEAQSRKLTAELDTLAPVVELDERLAAAEQLFAEIAIGQATLDEAERLERACHEQRTILNQQSAISETLQSLPPPPRMAPVEPLWQLILTLETEERKRRSAAATLGCLSPLAAPPRLSDVASLEKRATQLARQHAAVEQWQIECARLAPLSPPPELADVESLQGLLDELISVDRRVTNATNVSRALALVTCPPDLGDETQLRQLIGELDKLSAGARLAERRSRALAAVAEPPAPHDTASVAQLLERLSAADQTAQRLAELVKQEGAALAEATAQLHAAADGALCPLCGSKIDADRLLAQSSDGPGGHTHER